MNNAFQHNSGMEFRDREPERRRLRRLARGAGGGLLVVWGRRRVGKSRLLLEWIREGRGLYWVADESAPSLQRRYLAGALEARLPGFGRAEYPDWASLFARLGRDAKNAGWRGPLVLDEFPYLARSSPELPSVLQGFVDRDAHEAGLVLALAGSSQRMMQGLVLRSDAPLYGRAREAMKLLPIPPGHLGPALGLRDPVRAVEAYAAWGGIPRYWELAAPYRDTRRAVDDLVLDPLGPLHDEPARLLIEETPPATALRPVLDAIGSGAHRVSEIAGRLEQPATSLARPLARLQELDLVEREIPFGEPERSGKRALYKLADPFLRLWFTLVAPRRGFLAQASRRDRMRLFDEAFPRLVSLAWEELCRRAVPLLGGRWGPARRFWLGAGPEWDVVARSKDALLLGEAKWSARELSPAEVERSVRALRANGVPAVAVPPGTAVHSCLFAPRLRRPHTPARNIDFVDAAEVLSVLR
ncbi:MAG: ATP-binding protein [Planctomycetes bacterium]|nr:ATP-binding protein [Planctomycetota bacterium]